MDNEFWGILERKFVEADTDNIMVPGPNSATTSNPDVTTIQKDEENYPIFILPGVMGSDLYIENIYSDGLGSYNEIPIKVWAPHVQINTAEWVDPLGNLKKLDIDTKLITIGHDEQRSIPERKREYGALDWYKELLNRVCSEFGQQTDYEREVYFFSYDWRQDNQISADKLLEFINNKGYPKIDLICHSMGGIVASHFCLKARSKINKVITLSTPYEGSPKLLSSLLTKEVLDDDWVSNTALSLLGLSRKLKTNLPGPVELAPTVEYLNVTPQYKHNTLIYETVPGTMKASPGGIISQMATSEFQQVCEKSFPPYLQTVEAQNKIKGTDGLVSLDNSFFAFGCGEKTINSVEVYYDEVLRQWDVVDLRFENYGDGTVPFFSGTKHNQLLDLGSNRMRYFNNFNHNEMAGYEDGDRGYKPEIIDWVVDILKDGKSSKGTAEPAGSNPFLTLRAACPVEVTVTNGAASLSSASGAAAINASFGELLRIGHNGEIKMMALDMDNYQVTLRGTGTGTMDYSLRYCEPSGFIPEERVFKDVPITDTTVITTNTNLDEETVLLIDKTGDGNIDEVLTAEVIKREPPVDIPVEADIPVPKILPIAAAMEAYELASTRGNRQQIMATVGIDYIPYETLQALAQESADTPYELYYYADQIVDRRLVSRVIIKPAESTKDIYATPRICSVANAQDLPEAVIDAIPDDAIILQTGQKGTYGQTVDIMIKVDLTQWDNLYIYQLNDDGAMMPIQQETYRFHDGYNLTTKYGDNFLIGKTPFV